jgi:hypothetical protein
MKLICGVMALGAGLALAGAVSAEPYKEWTPGKGAIEVVTIKVEPNHVDDYLTGLAKSWVPDQESRKKHGYIRDYFVSVKLNGGAGANVLLGTVYADMSALEPDKARHDTMHAEALARMSQEESDKMVAGYDKYRTFVSDDIWRPVEFPK